MRKKKKKIPRKTERQRVQPTERFALEPSQQSKDQEDDGDGSTRKGES